MKNSVLNFLGKDSGFGNNNTSAYIEENNDLYIIDCGFTVFNKAKNKFKFNTYNNVYIIITHLHNDHAGSLSQLILYLWFVYNKKTTVISKCINIKNYLKITGTPEEAYEIKDGLDTISFIPTTHTLFLDSYGFIGTFGGKKFIYTGDTNSLENFIPFFNEINELYIDVSKYGGAHLKIDDIIDILYNLKQNEINIIFMHMDDKDYIQNIINKKFNN